MTCRFTWRETRQGHWICERGAYAAVLELGGDDIQIRIKLPDDSVVAFVAAEDIPAFAKIEAEQRLVAEATARGELALLWPVPRRR